MNRLACPARQRLVVVSREVGDTQAAIRSARTVMGGTPFNEP